MLDRLAELTGGSKSSADYQSPPSTSPSNIGNEIESSSSTPQAISRPKFMEEFFQLVEEMQQDMDNMGLGTQRISELNQQALIATSSSEEHAISTDLGVIIATTNQYAAHAKGCLDLFKKQLAEKKKDKNVVHSELRIRENMTNTLTKKFLDTMKAYQKAQTKYKSDMKSKVKRQIQVIRPNATDDEIADVLSSGDSASIYKKAILTGQSTTVTAEAIKDIYLNCADKYADVLKLEQSVAELHQMFLDLALLVEQQGEILDQVETQVRTAANYIEQGNKEVVKALVIQKKARNKKCFLLFIGLGILLVIILVAKLGA